jgi:hypothetical protein
VVTKEAYIVYTTYHNYNRWHYQQAKSSNLPHLNLTNHWKNVCKLFTFQASSPKPLGQLEPNLAGMFLGWSSTKWLFFIPVGYSIWLPRPIICSDWLKFQRSSSLKLMNIHVQFGFNHICSFWEEGIWTFPHRIQC